MKFYVYGLGYVGSVSALNLAQKAIVVGVESVKDKVDSLNKGVLHLHEEGLGPWLSFALDRNQFRAEEFLDSIPDHKACFMICVGTPSGARGDVDISQLKKVLGDIVKTIKNSPEVKNCLFLVRSTLPPGTCRKEVYPFLSKHLLDINWSLVYYPEFMREGQAIEDCEAPKLRLIGLSENNENLDFWSDELLLIFNDQKFERTSFESAEMLKYSLNVYNALKVSFANELSSVAESCDVNINEHYSLIEKYLDNVPAHQYLRPGFCYGGPCLTKEVNAINWFARQGLIETPVLSSIQESNLEHLKRYQAKIEKIDPKKVLLCGVSFKPDTDDLRDSFVLRLAQALCNRPSYKENIDLTILETTHTIDNIEKYWSYPKNVSVCSTLEDDRFDLVILGPFKLSIKEYESLECTQTKILNLGFHNYDD